MPAKPILLLALAAVLTLLSLPAGAGALSPPGTSALPLPALGPEADEPGAAGEDEAEGEEGELEAEGCEEADEECWEEETEAEAAEECLLTGAEAAVAADSHSGKVRLSVRYDSFRPAAVAIEVRLRGSRGAADLGTVHAHFGRRGVFHDTLTPGRHRMAKVLAADQFTVVMHAVNTPRSCRYVVDDRLRPRARGGKHLWS